MTTASGDAVAEPRIASAPLLRLDDISHRYGAGPTVVRALDRVDLTLDAGEFVAIMGASGSGKSTLLALAGGLETPTSGRVLLDGGDLAALRPAEAARMRRRTLGYVFQDLNLIPVLTVRENVTLPLELDGWRGRNARRAAETALENTGITELADRYPAELSGGQQQRVAIARAVVGERRLLLADEPTGALDSTTGESVMRVLRGRADSGIAVMLVTHDARLAAWADRTVFVRDGRLVDQTAKVDVTAHLAAAR
jgi:putative ABC transport system ATP-binding protein